MKLWNPTSSKPDILGQMFTVRIFLRNNVFNSLNVLKDHLVFWFKLHKISRPLKIWERFSDDFFIQPKYFTNESVRAWG